MYNYMGNVNFKRNIKISFSIIALFALYNIYGNILFLLPGIVVWIASILFLNTLDTFLIFIALTPHIGMLKIFGTSYAIYGYLMLAMALKYFLSARNFKANAIFLVHLFLVGITVITCASYSLATSLIRCMLLLIFLSAFFQKGCSLRYREQIIRAFLFGLSLSVLVGIAFYIITNKDIFSGDFAGIREDRNYFSTVLSVGIGIAIIFNAYTKKRIINFLEMLVLLYGGILSASRTFLISLVWSALLLFFFIFQTQYKKRALWLITILILVLIILGNQMLPILQTALERFSDETVEGGNGRFAAWSYYINIACSTLPRFLLGSGATSMYLSGIKIVEHNTFIQTFFTVGLLGTVTLFACYFSIYRRIVRTKFSFKRILLYMPLLAAITGYTAISAMYSDTFTIVIFVTFIIISFSIDSESQNLTFKSLNIEYVDSK